MAIELSAAVQNAILNNPEVLAKLHQFRGAGEDVNQARADYMPTVDMVYEANRLKYDYPDTTGSPASQHYTTKGWSLNVTQNLFQGLQTFNSVRQLGYDQQARYFDFLDETESMALQTTQAYEDVLRYRRLVDIAKDNYAVHKGILDQIVQKVQAGVGRRVDLEQAAGRLALAESNLLSDVSNLHDIAARYERLVGQQPPELMAELPPLQDDLPKDKDLLKVAVNGSPAYMSTLAAVRSASAEVDIRRGAFAPTLNLQASKAPTDNYDGYVGRTNQSSVAIIFNMNLFRGGADRARLGSAAERLNNAKDLREKECRDLRQTVSIANDNVIKLKAQMVSMRQHQLSTEKARDAYRKQFDIGQRTLLDVLDSENELFDAERTYINAQADYIEAAATVLGNSGRLLAALHLKPIEDFQVNHGLADDAQNSCDTSYTTPASVDVNSIPVPKYISATTSPTPIDAPPQILPLSTRPATAP